MMSEYVYVDDEEQMFVLNEIHYFVHSEIITQLSTCHFLLPS